MNFPFSHHQNTSGFDLNIFPYVWILIHLIAAGLQSFPFSLKNVHSLRPKESKRSVFLNKINSYQGLKVLRDRRASSFFFKKKKDDCFFHAIIIRALA